MGGTEVQSYRRARYFIDALFQHTDQTLKKEFDSQLGMEKVAREFRIRMTQGQTMKEHNEFRRHFYQEVIGIAEKLMAEEVCLIYGCIRRLNVSHKVLHLESDRVPGYTSPPTSTEAPDYTFSPAVSCSKLVESLKARDVGRVSGKRSDKYPLIILAFDEAHTLINREETDNTTWSNFSVLRHVLRALCHLPLFALFLSTMGKISQFTSPVQDTSKRIANQDLTLIKPFTDLGFDMLAKQVDLGGRWNLELVTADAHIVYMGRPL
jgi:hypothetical protein